MPELPSAVISSIVTGIAAGRLRSSYSKDNNIDPATEGTTISGHSKQLFHFSYIFQCSFRFELKSCIRRNDSIIDLCISSEKVYVDKRERRARQHFKPKVSERKPFSLQHFTVHDSIWESNLTFSSINVHRGKSYLLNTKAE